MMHSVRFHQHGGVDVLRYEDVPEPELGPGDVLVRVRACALNHLDLWERRGLPHVPITLPRISGGASAADVARASAPCSNPASAVDDPPHASRDATTNACSTKCSATVITPAVMLSTSRC